MPGAHCEGADPSPYGVVPDGQYAGGRSDDAPVDGGRGCDTVADWFVAGGVNKFPTLTLTGGWETGGWLACADCLGGAPANGGGGSSKLGSVGAPGRRVFNGWEASASSAVPIPGAGTAMVARLTEVSRGAPAAKRSASGSDAAESCPAKEFPGFNVQSRPPGRAPEGLVGSRRGEPAICREARSQERSHSGLVRSHEE